MSAFLKRPLGLPQHPRHRYSVAGQRATLNLDRDDVEAMLAVILEDMRDVVIGSRVVAEHRVRDERADADLRPRAGR